MASSTVKRQSAAVMFTDIAGYTSIMASDEEKALSLLKDKRKILKPLIKQHDGVYVKGTGDGTLSYFDSAYNASKCAKLFQESIYDNKNMNVRVGIHVGDIVLDDGDVYGDGVNVASRLESMSPVGGICVSNTVYDELRNKKEFDGVELGLQSLKGVGRLIEIYGLKGDLLTEPKPSDYQDNKVTVHSDDEVPSVAIIPLKNKGSDDDIFYSYGISADLIKDCSGAGLIRVESLDRIEKIENYEKLDITELASKLLVRYVATGTLWKMGDVFQLSVELYDTKESKVIWSDRWQENWDNLPAIKGSLSDGLLKALDTKPKVERKLETTNPEAYEFYLKGRYRYVNKLKNMEDIEIVRGLLQQSINLDNNLLLAKNMLGVTYLDAGNLNKAMEIFTSIQKQAEEIGDNTGVGLNLIGLVYVNKGKYDMALDYYSRSFKIKKEIGDKRSMGFTLLAKGFVYGLMGDYDKAVDHNARSLKLNTEIDDRLGMGINFHGSGFFSWSQGDLETALKYWTQSLEILQKENAWTFFPISDIGIYHFDKGDYATAITYLEKSFTLQRELENKEILIWTATYLFLSYKKIKKQYDETVILTIIEETVHIEDFCYYALYQLLEDTSYLETAYNQVREKAVKLKPDVAAKFLSYPIPKAIVEEWEKVK